MPRKPARKAAGRKRSAAGRMTRSIPPSARRVRGGLQCPDCDFVARHAMGLGRHRSARHGTPSKRSARKREGRWLTRHQAAERAGVHYNTVRQWEQSGLIRTTRRPTARGLLLSGDDLERVLVERGGYRLSAPSTEAGQAAIAALQERYDRLIADLESLLVSARAARPAVATARTRAGRPPVRKARGRVAKRTRASTTSKRRARTRR